MPRPVRNASPRRKTLATGPRRTSNPAVSTRVSVIGTGYVGLVTGVCLAETGHHVICVDRNPDKVAKLLKGISPIFEPGLETLLQKNLKAGRVTFTGEVAEAVRATDIIFIAVNTPPRPDGKADLSHVANAARQIAEAAVTSKIVVDKSTVPVKTGEKVEDTLRAYNPHHVEFDVVSNPEFLREGTAVLDFLEPDRIVVGADSPRAAQAMRDLYRPIRAPFILTDITSAELIKHASNSFLATKISFANALAILCERAGADVEEVMRGVGLDKRIGHHFLRAGIGYGGSCFPKDVAAHIAIADELGYDFALLKAVQRINEETRDRFVKKIEEALWVTKGKTIAVWGLAFKPNTDDMRNAPSVPIIERLLSEGSIVKVFDPVAMEKARTILGDRVTYAKNPYDAVKDADALVIATEWEDFQTANLQMVRDLLRQPLIFDGRNLYDPAEMERLGFTYLSVGRPPRTPATTRAPLAPAATATALNVPARRNGRTR